ncbi:MAG: glycosyltransferase family 4 protein [Chloroflexi bacterium]|nr:glycosyltransferase family 4 protein [Chloroflexota bacterium]
MQPLRVLMLSKACIVGIYQRKLEDIARLGIDLLAVVPPSWQDERGEQALERVYTSGYRLEVLPLRFNGSFHLHHYVGLGDQIRRFRPHIVHIDEEPYNLATWQALYHARRAGAKTLFFSWQNIQRDYPPPFSWGERWVLRHVDYAIVGTDSAAAVWRAKGYTGPLAVIPQFGVDPELFQSHQSSVISRQSEEVASFQLPVSSPENSVLSTQHSVLNTSNSELGTRNSEQLTIGYIGRLVPEKGVHLLLDAAARLPDVRLRLIGGGPEKAALQAQAERLGMAGRVTFVDQLPSIEMPAQYRQLDALALPSLTRPNWKEQFGRVLVEAMASGVPVVGSDSGAIPDVIGGAGLVFPEGDVNALTDCLRRLQADAKLRADLAQKGRARVLAHFTQQQVAAATVAVYREMMETN